MITILPPVKLSLLDTIAQGRMVHLCVLVCRLLGIFLPQRPSEKTVVLILRPLAQLSVLGGQEPICYSPNMVNTHKNHYINE